MGAADGVRSVDGSTTPVPVDGLTVVSRSAKLGPVDLVIFGTRGSSSVGPGPWQRVHRDNHTR